MMKFLFTPFWQCSTPLRAFLGTWSLLICLAGAYNLISALKQQKRRFLLGAVPLWILGMIFLQATRTAAVFREEMPGNDVTAAALEGGAFASSIGQFGRLACFRLLAWLLVLLLLTIVASILTLHSIQWRKTHITPLSIQESFERLTEGLCYYREGGQCILVNSRMQEYCRKLTGHSLLNGEELAEAVLEGKERDLLPMEDRTVLVTLRSVTFEGEPIHEIVVSDVTELYQKTKELQAETERLKSFREELQRYHFGMQENVRGEEILRAKMNIHDEMNRLLLSTRNAIASGDPAERQAALLSWKSNALLLCKESEGSTGAKDALRDLQVIAKSLGVELVMIGSPETQNAEALRLFVVVTREAMNNAVKHAGAKHVYVEVCQDGAFLHAIYTNDGRKPEEAPAKKKTEREKPEPEKQETNKRSVVEGANREGFLETGGLKNMRQKLEEAGGSMEVTTDKGFRLEIQIRV